MDLQVKESLLERCVELEQTARDQATDNAILDQLRKVFNLLQNQVILSNFNCNESLKLSSRWFKSKFRKRCSKNKADSFMEPDYYKYRSNNITLFRMIIF